MESGKLPIVRWLMLAVYLSVLWILGEYHLHMSKFNEFFIIMMISTTLLVVHLWFLRDKGGGRLTNKD